MTLEQAAVAVPVGRSAAETDLKTRTPTPDPDQNQTICQTPPIDIYEGSDGLVLEADLPGVAEDQLSIQLQDNVLHLFGKVIDKPVDGARLLHEEYRTADFARSFILSDEVDRSRITASTKNGVLRIALPRSQRSRTHRIEIKSS